MHRALLATALTLLASPAVAVTYTVGTDIFDAPIRDLKDYLAPGAADYCPSLQN